MESQEHEKSGRFLVFYFCKDSSELTTVKREDIFCGCLIELVCIFLWCWGFNVHLIVSVPDCNNLLSD